MSLELRRRLGIASDRLAWLVRGVPLDDSAPVIPDRLSPRRLLEFEVGGQPAQLSYGSPQANGRVVLGELIEYDQLWRMGADEPSLLRLPFSAEVVGARVGRGVYALYVIPRREGPWTLVINRSIRQSGRTRQEVGRKGNVFPSDYTPAVAAAELSRVEVDASTDVSPHEDALVFDVEPGRETTTLVLRWSDFRLRIPIRPA